MKTNTSIKLKAGFLLTVFALNTVVGFACSVGMDMGFNSRHHPEGNVLKRVVHKHADGQHHVHNAKKESRDEKPQLVNIAGKAVVHVHKGGKRHVHNENEKSQSDDKLQHTVQKKLHPEQKSGKENCCTDEVRDFQLLEKSVPPGIKVVYPIYFTAFVAVYYNITLLPHTDILKDIKLFVRSYHPPIPDIRIAIQSFQL